MTRLRWPGTADLKINAACMHYSQTVIFDPPLMLLTQPHFLTLLLYPTSILRRKRTKSPTPDAMQHTFSTRRRLSCQHLSYGQSPASQALDQLS